MWRYYLLRIAGFLFNLLPVAVGQFIAMGIGEIAFRLGGKARRDYLANLRQLLGPDISRAAQRKLARQAFHNLALNYYDLLRIPRVPPERVAAMVDESQLDPFITTAKQGATVLASAHLGNLDLVTQLVLHHELRTTVLVEQLEPPRVHAYVMRMRNHQGMSFQPVGIGGLKVAFRALHNGELVALACDKPIHGQGIVVDFCGAPALMPTGAADLVLRTRAQLVCAVNIRTSRSRYAAFAETIPIPPEMTHTKENVRLLTEQILTVIAGYLREYPAQWMVFTPVWLPAAAVRASVPREDHASPTLTDRGKA